MRRNRMDKIKRTVAVILSCGMLFSNNGAAVLAETAEVSTEAAEVNEAAEEKAAAEKAAAEKAAAEQAAAAEKAAAEKAAAEQAAKEESERLAAEKEAAEKTESEQKVTESAPETEAQTDGKSTEAPVTEAQTETKNTEGQTEAGNTEASETEAETTEAAVTETDTETVTEAVTEEESTEAVTETESESETETESETESESETETEVVLDTVITQEVFQKTLEDQSVQPMIKYTIKVVNKTEEAAAENITVKAVMADHLVTVNQEGTTSGMAHYNTLEDALNANAFEAKELDEADKSSYAGNEVVMWKNQNIAEGAEKSFVFYAFVNDGIVDPEELRNVWIINGEKVTDTNKIQWIGTELLEVKKELPTEFVFENEVMIVTATLSDANILPEGVTFVVREKELTEEARELLEESLESDQTVAGYTVYDMHFELDGQEIEPEGGTVSVSVRYKEDLQLVEQDEKESRSSKDTEVEEYKVFHVSDANAEKTIEDVTDHVEGTEDGLVSEVGFTTESFSDLIIAALTPLYSPSTDPENRTFSAYLPYRIESFLQGYNVLAFGNVDMTLHCMGAVLVGGDFNNTSSGYADGENLPPSYVKGKINGNAVYNSRNKTNNKPLYAGSSNTVEVRDEGSNKAYFVNDVRTGNAENGTAPAYQSDNFFDFGAAESIVNNASAALQANAGSANVDNGTATVVSGTKAALSSLSGISVINIQGDMTAPVNTVINILDSGSVLLPQMNINGSQPGVQEQGSGTSIVWNLPNATKVTVPSQNWVGHIIAPNAHVVMSSGNYNGSVICQSMYSNAEGHIYPYNGGTLVPTSGDFVARKRVNGEIPASTETFRFTMTQIDGKDTFSKTVENTGETVDFGTISYSEAGTYYYIIEENAENPLAGYTYDTAQYLVEVIVSSTQSGSDTVLSKEIRYYQIMNASDAGVQLKQINEKNYYVSEAIDVPVFNNLRSESESGSAELRVQKTYNGTYPKTGFTFKVEQKSGTAKMFSSLSADGTITVHDGNAVSLGTIEFANEENGTYEYTISEAEPIGTVNHKKDGITYDTTAYDVKITVADGSLGQKAVTVETKKSTEAEYVKVPSGTVFTAEFTNNYSESGSAELQVKKNYEGVFPDAGFTFKVEPKAGTTKMFSGLSADGTITVHDGNAVSLGTIEFVNEESGTYEYTISEAEPIGTVDHKKDGITYDTTAYDVKITVADGSLGQKAVTVETKKSTETEYVKVPSGTVFTAEFTNNYSESGSAELQVKKNYEGVFPDAGFTFKVEPKAGTTKMFNGLSADGTITVHDGNAVSLGTIEFANEENGTYEYTISEAEPIGTVDHKKDGITYDTTAYDVMITVADGSLGQKAVTVETKKSTETEYVKVPSGTVFTAAFTNTYSESGSATLQVKKNYEGVFPTAGFTFKVEPKAGTTKMFSGLSADGTITVHDGNAVSLGTIEFANEENGTYEYTISEAEPIGTVDHKKDGITYDTTAYDVKITVADGSLGQKAVTVETKKSTETEYVKVPSGTVFTAEFTNNYSESGSAELQVKKNYEGVFPAEGFTFKVEPKTGTTKMFSGLDREGKITVTDQNVKSIGTIAFDKDEKGTYEYTISEVIPEGGKKDGITYDTTVYDVQIVVEDGADGQKAVTVATKKSTETEYVEVTDGTIYTAEFTNTYSAAGEFTLKALKSMKSSDTKLGTFQFELKDENGNVVETVSNDADGVIAFSKFSYTLEDAGKTFTYTVSEKQPSQIDQYIYDNTVYKVAITVTDNGDGTLKTEAKVGEDAYTDQAMKFVNDVTSMKVRKTDIADGRDLKGAQFQVLDQAGKVMESWTSVVEAHEVKGLTPGAVYTLREVTAPFGYDKITSDIQFTIDKDGVVTVISAGKNAEGKAEASADGNVLIVKDTAKVKEASLQVRKVLMMKGTVIEMGANFEIGLFTDKAGTDLYAKETFNMASGPVTVTFKNLPEGTYYVYELDYEGNAITGAKGMAGEIGAMGFEATVSVSRNGTVELKAGENDTTPVVVTNDYPDLPGGFTTVNIDISGKKTWVDDNNAAEKRPGSLKLTLNNGQEDIVPQSSDSDAPYYITWDKSAGSDWTYLISNVPKLATNGENIEYTITEESVDSYTAEAMTVTGERDSYDNIINANFKNTYEKPDLPSGDTYTQKNLEKKQSAKTGDNTNIMMYILLAVFAVVAGGAAIYLKRRRRIDK